MPWNEVSIMSLRQEFVSLAQQPNSNISELCSRFGISRKTGYKWLKRYSLEKVGDLTNKSRRPHHSPRKTSSDIETLIIKQRLKHPAWGGRKLKRSLENEGHSNLPSPSTITEILRRNSLLTNEFASHPGPFKRFEHALPNDLWQMDFKGPIKLERGQCHALTILDDHSRYSLGVRICGRQVYTDTKEALRYVFRRYGLPKRMTMDNGNPWGNPHGRWTQFAVWLLDQGIQVSYSRPYHPQTQGKDERFHRSLKIELLLRQTFKNAKDIQQGCDHWRTIYNEKRPHDALDLEVPVSRYQVSNRKYKEIIKPFEYAPNDKVRKVATQGQFYFKGKSFKISEAFRGQSVGLRPTVNDGVFDVYYRHQKITSINL